ncbi:hypothetical protein BaRGS_00012492 [Batillaria attramentaria]|uniref:Uncharacterized protein n=1 Tax=Batillaria attramentaria TaxID=370345 RepID=A0ABD0LAB7_9CAEN
MAAPLRLLKISVLWIIFSRCLAWDNEELELFDLVEEVNANFYEVLGVGQDASSAEIRKAYRKLSLQLHPDKNKAEDAEEKFRQLVAVYEVLKDEEKRQRYNLVLVEGLPDWRTPVFYYRRARKMGFAELSAVLAIISTIGQYLVGWAVYIERRLTLLYLLLYLSITVTRKPKRRQMEFPEYSGDYDTATPVVSVGHMETRTEQECQLPTPSTKGGEWSEEEQVLLAKAVNKFPGGTLHRWEKIANMVGRSVDEVSAKSKTIKGTYTMNLSSAVQSDVLSSKGAAKKQVQISDNIITTADGAQTTDSSPLLDSSQDSDTTRRRHRPTKIPKTAERTGKRVKTGSSEVCVEGEMWTQNQQANFEWALRHFPKGTDKRWDKIAEQIPGKTKEDCIVRFKYLAELVKKKKEDGQQS